MNGEIIQITAAETQSFLTPVLLWGLDFVSFVQGVKTPWLTAFMKIVSDTAFVITVPALMFLFWCIDTKKGIRLGILAVLSAWLNSFLKVLLKQPRPFDFDPSLGLAHEMSFGFPSGHSQAVLVLLVPLAYWAALRYKNKRNLFWFAAVFFILLTGLSRIYLGVHFPTDLAGGWLAGGCLIALFCLVLKRALKLLAAAGKRGQVIISAAAAFVMMVLLPEDYSFAALLFGFAGGYSLMINDYPFSAAIPPCAKLPGFLIRLLRFVTGMAGAALIYFGLKLILPGEGSVFSELTMWGPSSSFAELGRFIRYGLLGLWTSAGAPLCFGNLKLAEIAGKFRKGEKD